MGVIWNVPLNTPLIVGVVANFMRFNNDPIV